MADRIVKGIVALPLLPSLSTWVKVCEPCRRGEHGKCTGDCDCAKNGHRT